MTDKERGSVVSPFGRQAARAEQREKQRMSFKKNAGAVFSPDGSQQSVMLAICEVAWRAGGTVTYGRTQRGDAISVRVWRAGEPVIQDYLTNEDDFDAWLVQLRDALGVPE